MDNQNLNFISLENLNSIARGDELRILKYLKQFESLIPERVNQLKQNLESKDRIEIRQLVHKMSPQLQFFGIKNIETTIQRLEFEYLTMEFKELEKLVKDIILKLDGAVTEVTKLINQHAKHPIRFFKH